MNKPTLTLAKQPELAPKNSVDIPEKLIERVNALGKNDNLNNYVNGAIHQRLRRDEKQRDQEGTELGRLKNQVALLQRQLAEAKKTAQQEANLLSGPHE